MCCHQVHYIAVTGYGFFCRVFGENGRRNKTDGSEETNRKRYEGLKEES